MTSKTDELEQRIAALEARNVPYRETGLWTDTSKWSVNSQKGTGDNGVIDLSSEFGLPAKIRAVDVRVDVHDTAVTLTSLGSSSGSTTFSFYTDPGAHDEWMIHYFPQMPCDANGDVWVTFTGTIYFIMYITAYYV
jgi:hypothetical protein